MNRFFQSSRAVYLVAGFLSILLSLWVVHKTEIINPDAVCYLQSAESVPQGLHYVMHLCGQAKWPFYSVLISSVVRVTGFSYENAAYFIDGIFSLISVLSFIGIVGLLRKNQGTTLLWLAALVILLSNVFNDVRHYIVRDHGYFAFYLVAIFFLLQFFQDRKWYTALAWGFFSILATLFRIEGAIFLVLIPWIVFLDFQQSFFARVKYFLQLNALSILGALFVGGVLLFLPSETLGRLQEINPQRAVRFISHFQNKAELMKLFILNKHAAGNEKIVLFLTLIVWYLYSAVTNVSLIYMLLVIYAWSKKLLQTLRMKHIVLWAYLVVNVGLTFIFLTENMFISKRYLIAQSLILMLWVSFALFALLQQWKTRKTAIVIVFILILVSSASGIFSLGYSKKYIRQAGDWLQQNVPPSAKLYSNDMLVMYYSHHYGDQIFDISEKMDKEKNFSQYDYLAIRVNKKDRENASRMLQEIPMQPIQVFRNSRDDQVMIFRR